MSQIILQFPESFKIGIEESLHLHLFLQSMMNRYVAGYFRYGTPRREKLYYKRLRLELIAYNKTGNFEQLLNIANYAILEAYRPQNKKFHFEPNVASVTREEIDDFIESK